MEMVYLGTMVQVPPWLRPWCYGSGIVLDNDCKVFSFLVALEEFFV